MDFSICNNSNLLEEEEPKITDYSPLAEQTFEEAKYKSVKIITPIEIITLLIPNIKIYFTFHQ